MSQSAATIMLAPWASWSLLTAWAGFDYSALDQALTFRPLSQSDTFHTVWTTPAAYGSLAVHREQRCAEYGLTVIEGSLPLCRLCVPASIDETAVAVEAKLGDRPVDASIDIEDNEYRIVFARGVAVEPRAPLVVTVSRYVNAQEG